MNKICDKKMNFEECELAIVRMAVDKAETKQGRQTATSDNIKKIIGILEMFLRKKKLIVYGGLAINNLLPKKDQFYDKSSEIPDYDFFSSNALNDAKELADIYVKEGFIEVEAKSGQHHGTYKLFVNFIPVADLTYIPKELFNKLKKSSISISGILYAPPNYLRMGMYLELSRPSGDVSRWEKVLKRLILLNKRYPLSSQSCYHVDFQRKMDQTDEKTNEIYEVVKNSLIDQGVVFFGGYALSLYSHYMPKKLRKKLEKNPDFDVLSEEPLVTAGIVKERLSDVGIKNVKILKRNGIGEIIAPHYEIQIGKDTIAFIFEPLACHSYNVIKMDGYDVKVATIDTMLSFYLAFLYADREYFDPQRISCMSNFLFEVQEKNRLEQKGLLKRFSLNCIGHQQTIEEMREEKSEKFKQLKNSTNTKEYEEWFLRYRPTDEIEKKTKNINANKNANLNANANVNPKSFKNKTTKKKTTKKNKTRKRGLFF